MAHHLLVKDLYRKDPVTIEANATVKDALVKMAEIGSNGLLVIADMRIIGILSLQDIAGAVVPDEMQANTALAGALYKPGYFEQLTKELAHRPITDVMRTDFRTITTDAHILEVAADFLYGDLYIVPVVEDDKLLGVISRSEIRAVMLKILGAT